MTTPPSDDSQFDRLVDGELTAQEYRQLVGTLDEEPGGWRRCALAFLEAQAWRRELPLAARPPVATQGEFRTGRGGWSRAAGMVLAVAASFLVAFALGLYARPSASNVHVAGPGLPAKSALPGPRESKPETAVAVTPTPREWPGAHEPAGRVTLVVRGRDGQPQQVEVPVFQSGEHEGELGNQPSAIPPEVLAALERMGHNVRRQQQMVPVNLQDGRRLVVPVEQLEIMPVSGPAYQ